jgi:hypothetical protein
MLNNEISYRAGGTIAPARFVQPDTTADEQCLQGTAGSKCIGISQVAQKGTPGLAGSDTTVAALVNDQIQIRGGSGNDAMLTYGGTVAAGDFLKSDSTGRGITASSGDEIGARALQAGVVGGTYRVIILERKA